MPSAEETTYLIEVMPGEAGLSQDSFTSRDVDALVSRIKENLRLSGLKSRSSLASASHKMRASPYRLPSRCTWPDSCPGGCCDLAAKRQATAEPEQPQTAGQQHQETAQAQQRHYRRCRKAAALVRSELDSYERFQALLRKGALIKEAVKRLQTNDEDEDEEEELDEVDGIAVVPGKSRRPTSTSATSTTLDSMDDDEDDEDDEVESDEYFFYRRKRFYYDDEDEPLPPVYQPLEL